MNEGRTTEQTGDRRVVFLLGPAGSGKTHRCLTEIREALLDDCGGAPLLLLAPKQATFQLERQLLGAPGLGGYTRLQILSFERLARELLDELNGGVDRLLDEEGRQMVLRALLADRHAELRLFRATARLPGFARQLSESLRELQEQRLQPDQLEVLAGRCGDEALAAKLHDLGLLLRQYQAWLADKALQDPYNLVSLAAGALRAARREPGRASGLALGAVWLDGFSELTPQELELLVEVIAMTRRATLAFCLPGFPEGDPPWVSAWSGVTGTFRSVWNQVSGITGATTEVMVLPEVAQATRFTECAPIRHLASHWNGGSMDSDPGAVEGAVRCVVCREPVAEATFVARQVLRYVREEPSRRYRDVGVLLRSFEGYHEVISRVFGRYDIPFFLDRREPVAHHPLAELIRYGLRTVAFGWQHDDWFGALKTGLVPVGESALDEIENEALARGWTGEIWHRPVRLPDDPSLERRLERTRRQLLPPFEMLARRLGGREGGVDGAALADALSGLWTDLRVADRLEQWESKRGGEESRARRFAAVHGTVWEQIAARGVGVPKHVTLDRAAMAAHHINARSPARAPALDHTIRDAEIHHARQLDGVAIPLRSNVAHLQSAEHNVVRGSIEGAAVVDVYAIAGHVADDELVQLHERRLRKVQSASAALKHRGVSGIGGGNDNGPVRFAVEICEVESGRVNARGQPNARAGFGLRDRLAKLGGVTHVYFTGESPDPVPQQHEADRWSPCNDGHEL